METKIQNKTNQKAKLTDRGKYSIVFIQEAPVLWNAVRTAVDDRKKERLFGHPGIDINGMMSEIRIED